MILVTGATGHLGANLVRRLLADGERVRVLLRGRGTPEALDRLALEQVEGDLRDPAACAAAVRGCRQIHHCAALISTIEGDRRHRQEIFQCNVLGTRNLLRAARQAGVKRVVVTGSFSAVGQTPGRPSNEDDPFNPFDWTLPYGTSKAFVEHECWKACAEGLEVVVAVSCAILGPHDYKPSRMGRVLCDFANGRMWAYIPGGFEFVAARDMVEGHRLAMAKGRPGQKYIFGSGFATVDELMGIFEEVTGKPRPRLRLPPAVMGLAAGAADLVLGRLVPHRSRRFTRAAVRLLTSQRSADTTKARTELGFQPTSIAAAIREAYEDFQRRGLIEQRDSGITVMAQRIGDGSARADKAPIAETEEMTAERTGTV